MQLLRFAAALLATLLVVANASESQLQSPIGDAAAIPATPATTNKRSSILRSTVERVFSRKRRFLLMPPGGSLKFNVSLNKRLLALVPRGFNFVIEIAFYYPTPGTRLDLLPQRLRPPIITTPKPRGTTEPLLVYIPGSQVRYKAKPAKKPAKVQRIGQGAVQWIDTPSKQHKYTLPVSKWDKYDTPAYAQKYEWTPAKEAQYAWRPAAGAKWTKWTTNAPPLQHGKHKWQQPQRQWWRSGNNTTHAARWTRALPLPADIERVLEQRAAEFETETKCEQQREHDAYDIINDDVEVPQYEPMYFPDLEQFDESKHYHSHRDRRQLFHHFDGLSKIFGVDMKSCAMRAICESKRLLLPKGYSMIHDILRLIFSFPTISGLQDEYSRVMQSDFETCDAYWRSKCGFSMLHWLLNPQKSL